MSIDTHNLIEQKQVAADVFVCLYQRPGLFMLRFSHADGSIVNPQRTGFELQNLTWNQRNMEGGGGEEVYFVLLSTERYSLRLLGKEVWSYGETPNMGQGLSEEAEAERERTFDSILNFMKNHPQTAGNVYAPGPTVAATEDTTAITFLDHGDMGVPWDPKLFLPNNFPRSGTSGHQGSSANQKL